MDVDLRTLMEVALEREKTYIREDREDYGCAAVFTVTPTGVLATFPDFEDEESKQNAYVEIVSTAKANDATAILTVNNAWTKSAEHDGELDDIGPGELGAHNASPCLLVTVSGPGMQSRAFHMPFQLEPDGVNFGELQEMKHAEVDLLPGWSDKADAAPHA